MFTNWRPVPKKPYGLCGRKAPCLLTGNRSLNSLMVCVDLKRLMVSTDVKRRVYLLEAGP